MKKIETIQYSDIGHKSQTLDIYLPEKDSCPIFIYFHGGGIEDGDKYDIPFLDYLIDQGIGVVSAEYRMYPNAKYPEFIQDAAAAVGWTFSHIREYVKCDKIYVGGCSAGAYISMMLCFDKKYLAPYGISPMDFAGFIHHGGQPTKHFNVCREEGIDTRRVIIDETAPIYHIGLSEAYPPMLFIVSDDDMENRYEQTLLMINTLKHFEYDMNKIKLIVTHGGHCVAHNAVNEDGNNLFGVYAADFIK